MKVIMESIPISKLGNYAVNEVPFAIYVSSTDEVSRRDSNFLSTYYDKVVDKKGNGIYYCNIIDPRKCGKMGYTHIVDSKGKEEPIEKLGLTRCHNRDSKIYGKSVVAVKTSGHIVNTYDAAMKASRLKLYKYQVGRLKKATPKQESKR